MRRRVGRFLRDLADRVDPVPAQGMPLVVDSIARRESIERIIQKSAEWGYSRGVAGAAKLTPAIEWREDGSWKITTP